MESNRLGTFDSQNFVWYSDVFNRGFMTPDGLQNPTLHVKPGGALNITLTNNTPAQLLTMTLDPPNCGATQMAKSSVNIHFMGPALHPPVTPMK